MEDDIVPEPAGASTMMGFVKTRPENNDVYVNRWKDDPWWPAIEYAHEELTKIIPGYNVAQIKEKFGSLRFYFDFPEKIQFGMESEIPGTKWYKTEAEVRERANAIVRYAEALAEGITIGRQQILDKLEDIE